MRERLQPDDDDGHGLKTGLVQGKEAGQDGGERVDGVVMHPNDPSWWLNRSNYPLSRALANFRRVVRSEALMRISCILHRAKQANEMLSERCIDFLHLHFHTQRLHGGNAMFLHATRHDNVMLP